MNLRLDQILLGIYEALGIGWALVAVGVLGYALTGNVVRAFGLAVLLLVAAQSWIFPALVLGRALRWWVLILVCVRGLLARGSGAGGDAVEGRARFLASAIGAVALASALWSDEPMYTIGVAASFVVTLIASFGVLWRLHGATDLLQAGCRGVTALGTLAFGGSFVWAAVAKWQDDADTIQRMGLGGRFSGVFFNANFLGILAMLTIPTLLATPRAWLGRLAWLRWPVLILASLALFDAGSRSALFGTVVAVAIIVLYRFGAGAVLTIALGSVGLVALVSGSDVEDIDATAVGHITRTNHIATLSGRLQLWQEGLDAVRGHEVTGLGWGASRLLHGADIEDSFQYGTVIRASNLHSTHIQILVDVGYIGLGLLWLFCLQVLLAGWYLLRAPRTERSVVNVMILACWVATFADTFVHGSILSTGSPSALVFWSAAVVIVRESALVRRGAAARAAPPAAPALTGRALA